ncbi:multidrug effflux MFS transporter [Sphingobacterium haloxyli]|uniref:Bcr/CflA family drug resistance efflux transporter n=1 Tax=Sphingobacterium haloxyli TaxID=2100533 RepID=A0A2S9J0L9_9SPHI|nr:multidrug effflux MFS transporter [Sphingobacterium haloxyli]PRD46310.1 Bcr/CflA family drug resistance efflux transporter [Sphingobacterium haloxyli]
MNINAVSRKKRFATLLTLGLLSAIGPFSIDMYLPAFETIALDFETTIEHIQLSLTSFFVGIAFGQLVYGPLLDKFGRKKPLLIGLVIYIGASILCAYTKEPNHLIFLRFMQALGSCSGMVASRAMVRDIFEPKEAAKVFSMLMLVIGISPIVAPSVGAFVLTNFDWHIIFVILAILAFLILLGVIFILPESYQGNKEMSLRPRAIIADFWHVFRNPIFLLYAAVGGFASSGLYAYLSGSPFVLQRLFGLSEAEYGAAFAFVASSLIIATQLNRVLLNRWNSEETSKKASFLQAAAGISLVTITLAGGMNLYVLLGLICLYLCSQGFIFPNTSALALAPFGKLAGIASALLGCIQMALGAFTSASVSYFHDGSMIPMVAVMCASASIACLIYFLVDRRKKNTVS